MYPSVTDLMARPDKTRLLEVRRALRSNLTGVVVLLISVGTVLWLNFIFPEHRLPEHLTIIGGFNLRILALIPALIVLEMYRRYEDNLYVLGSEVITHYEGRLSLSSSVPTLKYSDIKEISIKQNLFGRIFGYGDIYLDSPAHEGPEMIIRGVCSPLRLTHVIEDFRSLANRSNAARQS